MFTVSEKFKWDDFWKMLFYWVLSGFLSLWCWNWIELFWELVKQYRNAVISLVSFLIIAYALDAAFQYLFLENKKFQVKYIRTFVITTTLFEFFNFPLIITAFIKTLLYQLLYATIRFIRPDISFGKSQVFSKLFSRRLFSIRLNLLFDPKRGYEFLYHCIIHYLDIAEAHRYISFRH